MDQNFFFLKFSWKLLHNLIWGIQYSNSFFQICSSSSSFLPRLVKNVLQKGSKIFSHRFSWKLPYNLILIWRIQKPNHFSNFFIFNFIFASIGQKWFKKWVESFFFSDFHENFHKTQFWYGKFKNWIGFPQFFHLHLYFCLD